MIKKYFIGLFALILLVLPVTAIQLNEPLFFLEKDYKDKYFMDDIYGGKITIYGCVLDSNSIIPNWEPTFYIDNQLIAKFTLPTCEVLDFQGKSRSSPFTTSFTLDGNNYVSFNNVRLDEGFSEISTNFEFKVFQEVNCEQDSDCKEPIRGIVGECEITEYTQRCKALDTGNYFTPEVQEVKTTSQPGLNIFSLSNLPILLLLIGGGYFLLKDGKR